MALADLLVPVLEGAAHVHRSRWRAPAAAARPADLDEPVHGRGGAAGLVERCAGREDVAGVQADPDPRVVVERGEVGLEVVDAGAQRAALAGGRLEQQPRGVVAEGVEDRQQPLADLPHRRVVRRRALALGDARAGVHHHALGADLRGAHQVVGHRGDGLLVGRGGGGAEVDQVRRVHEHPHPALGACRRGTPRRRPGRPPSGPSRGGCRRTPGSSRSRAASALARAPFTSPVPTWTWVPTGLRRPA